MTIEGLAFRDRRTLAHLNEKDLLDIIEFLQNDRKQWINQFSKTHNESIKIQEENQELKKQLENSIKVNIADHKYASECEDKVVTLQAYQKKFTKWLEDEIHTIETTFSQINGNYGLMNEKLEALKEVLQKYKELIELKIKYKKLKQRYEKVSDELLKYIVKYGRIKSGRN